jgi:hypothetical protein
VLEPVRSDATIDYYAIVQRKECVEILPGRHTTIWGYEGTFPGPTVHETCRWRVVRECGFGREAQGRRPRACYVVLDTTGDVNVERRRVPYDIQKVATAIRQSAICRISSLWISKRVESLSRRLREGKRRSEPLATCSF